MKPKQYNILSLDYPEILEFRVEKAIRILMFANLKAKTHRMLMNLGPGQKFCNVKSKYKLAKRQNEK